MISVMAALLLAAADPAAAAPAAAPPPPAEAAAPKKPGPNDKVCWSEKPTGSHLPQEYCATRQEYERMQQRSKDDLKRNDRNLPPAFGPH